MKVRTYFSPNFLEPFQWNSPMHVPVERRVELAFEVFDKIADFDLGRIHPDDIENFIVKGAVKAYQAYRCSNGINHSDLITDSFGGVEIYDVQFEEWTQFESIEDAMDFIQEIEGQH